MTVSVHWQAHPDIGRRMFGTHSPPGLKVGEDEEGGDVES